MDFERSLSETHFTDRAARPGPRDPRRRGVARAFEGGRGSNAGERLRSRSGRAGSPRRILLGLAVPEAQGGMGMGFLELCLLLHEGRPRGGAGARRCRPRGGWALPIAEFGSEAQRERWLARSRGEVVLTRPLSTTTPPSRRSPATRDGRDAEASGGLERRLQALVPAAHRRGSRARAGGDRRGQRHLPGRPTPRGDGSRQQHHLAQASRYSSSNVRWWPRDADPRRRRTAGEGIDRAWLHQRMLVGISATQVGVSERALEITTGYLKQREQFGAPLGALPAVQHRCADCYIDLEAMRWVMWRAAWKLARRPRPAIPRALGRREVLGGRRRGAHRARRPSICTAAWGVDLDYPIHRYFLWAKSLELAWVRRPQLLRETRRGHGPRAGPRSNSHERR